MVTAAAGDDMNVLHPIEQGGRRHPELGFNNRAILNPALQGICDRGGLVEYFLGHIMTVSRLVGAVRRQFRCEHGPLHLVAAPVKYNDMVPLNLGDITFLQDNELPCHRQQGKDVGCDKMLTDAYADHQGAAFPGGDQPIRAVVVNHTQCIGAFQFLHGMFYRSEQVIAALQVAVDLVDDNLRIRFRCERVGSACLFLPQRVMILDDAVMYQGDFIPADMRVGIIDAGTAVSSPAGMSKTGTAVQGRCAG